MAEGTGIIQEIPPGRLNLENYQVRVGLHFLHVGKLLCHQFEKSHRLCFHGNKGSLPLHLYSLDPHDIIVVLINGIGHCRIPEYIFCLAAFIVSNKVYSAPLGDIADSMYLWFTMGVTVPNRM